jgi:hypothetical protein
LFILKKKFFALHSFPFLSLALATTGLIWARYSTQIIPINYNLMAVNLFVGGTGIYQLCRVAFHKYKASH